MAGMGKTDRIISFYLYWRNFREKYDENYCFRDLVEEITAASPEITSPATMVDGESGVDGVPETMEAVCSGETVRTGGISAGVEVIIAVVETGAIVSGDTTVIKVMRVSFNAGLLTLTVYWPGGISTRNP